MRANSPTAMPRKPKPKQLLLTKVTVVVNGTPVVVILHPPTGTRSSWYAYWTGQPTSKSTGCSRLEDAVAMAETMVRQNGRRTTLSDAVLSDEELAMIQRAHFGRKTEPSAQKRAAKSLEDTLDSLNAFKLITGLRSIAAATPDDCARFQRLALDKPKNWRSQHPKSKKTESKLSPNTVVKWSRSLQAAFERACRTAGKKCVRGVVSESKLLTSNPWSQFTWIEGRPRPVRQFDSSELLSLLDFLETDWAAASVGAVAAKVFLWSCCRKSEVAGLTWDAVRIVGDTDRPAEVHFQIVGKWGIERWFRIPPSVYRELVALRTSSPFVFGVYTEQIRRCHVDNRGCLRKIKAEYDPRNFGRWLYERIQEWSVAHPKGPAFLHLFRKTSLQHALEGEDVSRRVAADAGLGERVMVTNYTTPSDRRLRAMSNRTYQRIVLSLQPEVARRYGYVEGDCSLEEQVLTAVAAGDWKRVAELTARLEQERSNA